MVGMKDKPIFFGFIAISPEGSCPGRTCGADLNWKVTPKLEVVLIIPKDLLLSMLLLLISIFEVSLVLENDRELSLSRVIITDSAVPFVSRGGRLFPGQVLASDPGIEDGEQVLAVDRRNNPIRVIQIYKGA